MKAPIGVIRIFSRTFSFGRINEELIDENCVANETVREFTQSNENIADAFRVVDGQFVAWSIVEDRWNSGRVELHNEIADLGAKIHEQLFVDITRSSEDIVVIKEECEATVRAVMVASEVAIVDELKGGNYIIADLKFEFRECRGGILRFCEQCGRETFARRNGKNDAVNQRAMTTTKQARVEFERVIVFEQSVTAIVFQVQQQHQNNVDKTNLVWSNVGIPHGSQNLDLHKTEMCKTKCERLVFEFGTIKCRHWRISIPNQAVAFTIHCVCYRIGCHASQFGAIRIEGTCRSNTKP